MNHPDPSELYDGAVDHRGDALPYLSKSAKNMKMEELLLEKKVKLKQQEKK